MFSPTYKTKQAFISIIFIAILGSYFSFLPLLLKASAANVVAYIDLNSQPATAPSTVAAAPEVATSTADEFYYSYVASSTQFAAANTITITVPSGFTSVATCSSPTTDADGSGGGADGAVSVVGNTVTYTFSGATTLATTTGVQICFAATTPASAGNYTISHTDTNDTDVGAALIYVGDANDVTVTATVPTTLTLSIRNASTTALANTCALGTLNPTGTNNCSYRVAAGTNSSSGLTVRIIADDQLNQTTPTVDINDINTGTNTTIDAGVEEYGATVSAAGSAFTAGTGWGGGAYNDIPTVADAETEEAILDANAAVDDGNTANWATITHAASITAATAGGSYDQVVTYRAYANL